MCTLSCSFFFLVLLLRNIKVIIN
uniref:Uncharacterized protein n=1 Tax=Rhizophora mucronata TaxID=61149 RepID=A0A2P2QRB2_RHIMU